CARTGVCATAVARVAVGSHTRMRATFHAGAHDSAPTPLSRPQSGPPPAVSSEEERREEGEEEEGDPQAVHRSSSLLPWTRRIVSCRAPPCPIPSQWPAARASGPPAVDQFSVTGGFASYGRFTICPVKTAASVSPSTWIIPSAPLLKARKIEWSTRTSSPGASARNSTIAAPPAGISVVCTLCCTLLPPYVYSLSKLSPITWTLAAGFGPPLPTKIRTVSPLLIRGALSPVIAPTLPLKTT